LTLVKQLVELHGGTVAVASEGEGQGTEFTVRLPIAPAAGETASGSDGERDLVAGGQRILLVDDNVDGLDMLRMLLSTYGHQVATATTGRQGLEQVAAFAPTVVFLDIGMPGMDGYETARRMRR